MAGDVELVVLWGPASDAVATAATIEDALLNPPARSDLPCASDLRLSSDDAFLWVALIDGNRAAVCYDPQEGGPWRWLFEKGRTGPSTEIYDPGMAIWNLPADLLVDRSVALPYLIRFGREGRLDCQGGEWRDVEVDEVQANKG